MKIRPYVETHRCPAIAHKQLPGGRTVGGVGVASIGEAEMFAQNGISDILIASEVVGARKIARLCALARQVRVTVAVDSAANVADLSEAAESMGVTLNALVDINTGQERGGIAPGQPAVELAQIISGSKSLNFGGLMSLEDDDLGEDVDALAEASRHRIQQTLDTRELIEREGIAVATVSVSAQQPHLAGEASGVTEVINGAYALMDMRHGAFLTELEPAAKVMRRLQVFPKPAPRYLTPGARRWATTMAFPS